MRAHDARDAHFAPVYPAAATDHGATNTPSATAKGAPSRVTVRVPATSANVGVGYDCLGLALDLMATFTFEPADNLVIDGCPEQFRGEDNLVWTSYLDTCRRLYERPMPLRITIDSPIPLSGGTSRPPPHVR